MGKKNTLTEEQQKKFEKRLKELGLNPSHVVPELRTGATPGPTYLSNNPDIESAIPPQILTFTSLDEVKRLGGIPNGDYTSGRIEEHHKALPPWPEVKNNLMPEDLTAEENRNIAGALLRYVYGNSEKFKSYKTIIEKHVFPLEIAAFAVENVIVDPEHPLILTGSIHTYVFGIVTIKPGGQIICEVDADMTCQKMISEN
jgi:hypothetical protein